MKTAQHHFVEGQWIDRNTTLDANKCQLVLAFGSSELLIDPENFNHLRKLYPNADIVTSSTAGEIIQDGVFDDSIVATAIELENSSLKSIKTSISQHTTALLIAYKIYKRKKNK